METILSEKVLNSKLLANYFKDLCEDFRPPYRDECDSINLNRYNTNKKILDFLSEIERLEKEEKCDVETLKNDILKIKKLDCIHLETLWYLDVSKLITLSDIIKFYETSECDAIIHKIGLDFFDSLLEYKPNQSVVREEMLSTYVKVIFQDIEGRNEINWESTNTKYSLQSTVFNLIGKNLLELHNCDSSNNLENFLNITALMELISKSEVECVEVQVFFYNLIATLLQGLPKNKKTIFQTQEKIRNNVKDKKIYSFYTLISNHCNLKSLVIQLKTLLLQKSQTINWDNALIYVTFLGSSFQDGWSELKNLSKCILKKAFQNFDAKLLLSGFLIARQCCFEKTKNCFVNYSQWFSSTFSKESFINSKDDCNFFFNFLMDLVSFDPPYYSKIHINKLSSVPADCQFLLAEYISQVKLQLADMNVSAELGIFENPTEKKAAVFDVENVLEHFKNTNNILNTVFQASIFSKSYYEKKFLPELLSKYEGKTTPRHKLIVKLNSLGKIPSSAFSKYKEIQKSYNRLQKK